MARTPVQAAGGIVLRQAKPPLIAVVRLRKRNEWVLPKGKLDDGETPRDAAELEVNEETGHDVIVHEFLGTLVYESSGRSKVVHYWRMQADGDQVYELMTDIREVDWLPLEVAVVRLSRASERAFLENVGPLAVAAAIADMSKRKPKAAPATKAAAASKAAAATKAAPAKKRRPPTTPVPAKPVPSAPVSPPAAVVPVQLAKPALAPIELPPVAPEMPAVTASDVAESARAVEAAEPLPIETEASLPVDQAEPMHSAEPHEPEVAVPEPDTSMCEQEAVMAEVGPAAADETAEETDSAPRDSSEARAIEPRRKTLAEKLRNWLGNEA
jgi:8-oxo-dGTP diphosphatase